MRSSRKKCTWSGSDETFSMPRSSSLKPLRASSSISSSFSSLSLRAFDFEFFSRKPLSSLKQFVSELNQSQSNQRVRIIIIQNDGYRCQVQDSAKNPKDHRKSRTGFSSRRNCLDSRLHGRGSKPDRAQCCKACRQKGRTGASPSCQNCPDSRLYVQLSTLAREQR